MSSWSDWIEKPDDHTRLGVLNQNQGLNFPPLRILQPSPSPTSLWTSDPGTLYAMTNSSPQRGWSSSLGIKRLKCSKQVWQEKGWDRDLNFLSLGIKNIHCSAVTLRSAPVLTAVLGIFFRPRIPTHTYLLQLHTVFLTDTYPCSYRYIPPNGA